MSDKKLDRSPRTAESSKIDLGNVAGDIELTPEDLETIAGGIEEPTIHCTDNVPTLCPCAATIPESTCGGF